MGESISLRLSYPRSLSGSQEERSERGEVGSTVDSTKEYSIHKAALGAESRSYDGLCSHLSL